MSTTVDSRVVEMRFDNQRFERNISTTMSSLDKLKQKLNMDGAAKGMADIDAAARKIDMSGLAAGVEAVSVKFSSLKVMAVTALANITNSAVNAGKRIVSSLTIDPIKTGFNEYETKINAIQTIMSNTASKGTTMADVTRVIGELNEYADKTIYNFAEMTRNIGTFTAAGVGLEESASAIQGIANLAAASGSTSQQASTAMYQLSQALAAGTVKLMDWNSVVNAGMGGEKFQEALKATARDHGIAVDAIIEKNGSFRESLQAGWISADILNETLNKFTVDGAKKYAESMMASGKWTQEQADALIEEAKAMNDAATKVKTFTQLYDTLKESAQSGWAQTWELLVGNFEEAKETLTKISDVVGGMINKSAEARNNLLKGALTSNWDKMTAKINEAGIETAAFEEKVKSVAKSHNIDIDAMIKEHGSLKEAFRSGAISSDILKEAIGGLSKSMADLSKVERDLQKGHVGEDVKQVQQALKDLGYDLGTWGIDGKLGAVTEEAVKAFQKANNLKVTGIVDEETITTLEKATKGADGLAESCEDLINSITELGGRENLIKALWNVFDGLMSVVNPIKEAFREIFPPTTVEQVYSFTEAIRDFTAKFKLSDTASENLKRTFKGLFAVLDIGKQALGALFDALSPIFGKVDDIGGGILGMTAKLGDWLVALSEAIKSGNAFGQVADTIKSAFNKIIGFATTVIGGIRWFTNEIAKCFTRVADNTKERFSPLLSFGNFIKGVFTSLGKIFESVFPYVYKIITIITGLIKGLIDQIAYAVQNSDFDRLLEIFNGGVMATIGVFIAKFIKGCADIVASGGGMLDSITGIFEGIGEAISSFTQSTKSDILKKVAISIAILAASLFLISTIDSEKLNEAMLAIGGLLGGAIGTMSAFIKLMGDNKFKGATRFAIILTSLATSMLILSAALKILSGLSWGEMAVGLTGLVAGLAALVAAVRLLPDRRVKNAAKAIKKLAAAVLVLAVGIKIMSTISLEEMAIGLTGVVVGLAALVGAVRLLPRDTLVRTVGLIGLASAMIVLGVALKMMGSMSWNQLAVGITALAASMLILSVASKSMITAIPGAVAIVIVSSALITLAVVLKMLATISWDGVCRGLAALGGSLLILAAASRLMVKAIPGAVALVIISSGLMALIPVMAALGAMSWEAIAKGLVAIAGTMVVLGVAAYALTAAIPAMIGISVAIALIGVACAAVGAGVFMFGAALTALASGFSAIALGIVTIVTSIVSLIPTIAKQIGLAFVAFCEAIAGGASAIFRAIQMVILSVVEAFVSCVPAIVEGILVLVDSVLSSIAQHIPSIMTSLFDILIGITVALAERLPELIPALVDAIFNLVISLLDSLATRVPDLVKSLVNLIMSIFQGTIDALKGVDMQVLINGTIAVGILNVLLVLIANLAALVPPAMTGVLAMGLLIVELAGVLAAIGALAQIPGLDVLIGAGGNLLQAIGTALGQFVGGIVGGFAQGMTSSLPQVGKDLSAFMTNAMPFIQGVKLVDQQALAGVASLAGIITAITAADILQGLTSWLTGGSSIVRFGEELAEFGPYIRAYADSIAGIDTSAVTASATAAKALAEMASIVPNEGGVASWFAGENSIAKFGDDLVDLGKGLARYSNAIAGFDADAVISSAAAANAIAEMASNIPNEGGVASWFAGDNSIAKFGPDLVLLGTGLAAYSKVITDFDSEAVIASVNAANAIVEMTKNIPNEGGMTTWFAGDNSVAKFGTDLVLLGTGLAAYSASIANFNAAAVIASVNAANAIVDMTSRIPDTGGMKAWFVGDNSIANFGDDLVSLGNSLSLYSASITGVDMGIVTASAAAASALADMASKVPDSGGVKSWFTGENSVANFGAELVSLGSSLSLYSSTIAGFDANAVTASAAAATALADMTTHIPNSGGVIAWFSGDNSVAKFGAELVSLGEGLSAYSASVVGFKPDAVIASANAAKAIADMASVVPNEGGMVAWFAGDNSVAKFGTELVSLGDGLAKFSVAVTDLNVEAVTAAVNAAKTLADMSAVIPNTGGMVAWFAGDNSVAKFGTDLVALGAGLKGFSDSVVGIQVESMTAATSAATALANMSAVIPNTGGVAAWFAGDSSISKFGADLIALGAGLKGFSDSVVGIIPENVTAAASAAKALAEMASVIPDSGGVASWFAGDNSIAKFGERLPILGAGLKGFSDSVAGISPENVTTAANAAKALADLADSAPDVKKLVKAIDDMSKIKATDVDGFKGAIEKLADINIGSIVKEFESANSDMSSAGETLVAKFVEGFESQISAVEDAAKTTAETLVVGISDYESKVKSACEGLVSKGATAITDNASKFKSAGKDLGAGLVKGIESKEQAVYDAAYALGQMAVKGEKDGQKSKSPSKLTILAGKQFGQGLVIGIDGMGQEVYSSGYNLGKTATSALSSAISRIADVIDSDIDTQPTIRPVLDLSSVKSGTSILAGMLDMDSNIGVRANISAISSMMNARGQNGTNKDVVSAINKLNKKMDNLGNTTYQINGVTYDDGSNITDAVRTIVRAARIERRV